MRILLVFFLLTALGQRADANTSSVFSPSVKDGEQAFEYRNSYVPEQSGTDLSYSQRVHYQYGFNDSFRGRIIGAFSRRRGNNLSYNYTRLELMQQISEGKDTAWTSAIRYEVQVSAREERPDRLRIASSVNYNFTNGWQFRNNLMVGRLVGDNAGEGLALETRFQITKKMGAFGRLGLESFGDLNTTTNLGGFDEQEHQLGPVYKFSSNNLKFTLSYLTGVSDAADDDNLRLHVALPI